MACILVVTLTWGRGLGLGAADISPTVVRAVVTDSVLSVQGCGAQHRSSRDLGLPVSWPTPRHGQHRAPWRLQQRQRLFIAHLVAHTSLSTSCGGVAVSSVFSEESGTQKDEQGFVRWCLVLWEAFIPVLSPDHDPAVGEDQ